MADRDSKAAFMFIVSILIPGPPFKCLVMAWAADEPPADPEPCGGSNGIPNERSPSASEASADSASAPSSSAPEFDRCLTR